MESHFGQKLRFIFMMNGWGFHDDRPRLNYERLRFSWLQAEIFMITGWDFIFSFQVLLKEMRTQGQSKMSSFRFWANQDN